LNISCCIVPLRSLVILRHRRIKLARTTSLLTSRNREIPMDFRVDAYVETNWMCRSQSGWPAYVMPLTFAFTSVINTKRKCLQDKLQGDRDQYLSGSESI
jgi:hypothetical protein